MNFETRARRAAQEIDRAVEVMEMSSTRTPRKIDRFERYRDRRSRNGRIAAAAVGVGVVVAVVVAVVVTMEVGSPERTTGGEPTSPTTAPLRELVGTVTFDGSTCSMELTADPIDPGFVSFEVVNATDEPAMFDSWELAEGYTYRAFERAIEHDRRLFERRGDLTGHGWAFPTEEQVTFRSSQRVEANNSEIIVPTLSSGRNAIACLKHVRGQRFIPFDIVGPIVVG